MVDAGTEPPERAGDASVAEPGVAPRQRGGDVSDAELGAAPCQRGRHVPAAVKREVFARDAGCCGYVDARGERCGERRYLELHHLTPFAQGGEHVASNLALRCAAHNALAAEEDFGRSVVERHRTAAAHESFCAQERREVARLERGD